VDGQTDRQGGRRLAHHTPFKTSFLYLTALIIIPHFNISYHFFFLNSLFLSFPFFSFLLSTFNSTRDWSRKPKNYKKNNASMPAKVEVTEEILNGRDGISVLPAKVPYG
jgi:hypothetical protein